LSLEVAPCCNKHLADKPRLTGLGKICTLKFYQKWTAGPIYFHSALCISLEDGRSAFCSSFFLILWKPQVNNRCHSEAKALLELCVMNWDFTDSLLAVISLNLEWFKCREELQRAITWSIDSIRLPPPFNIKPTCHPPPLLLPPVIFLPAQKRCSKRYNLGVRNL